MADDNPWTLIFAGTADINENNLNSLLSHWLPGDPDGVEDVEFNAPVIQADVRELSEGEAVSSDAHPGKGLSRVLSWLTNEFGADGLLRVPSVLDHVMNLTPAPDQYLVVLWDKADPGEETEKLVDQAQRLGITVLDLTDGLEEFSLDSKPPEQEIQTISRATRRRTGTIAAAAEKEDTPVLEVGEYEAQDTLSTLAISPELVDRVVNHFLVRALTAALKELQETPGGTAAGNVTAGPADIQPPLEVSTQPDGNAASSSSSNGHPVQATPGRHYSVSDNVDQPAGTKRYAVDPDTGEHKRMRGRPRSNAVFVFLTPEMEREFGLLDDAPF